MYDENDVVPIGKLRRPGKPGAPVSYDPGYGIRVGGEDAPAAPAAAATWCRGAGGWLRVYGRARRTGVAAVEEFLQAWRAK